MTTIINNPADQGTNTTFMSEGVIVGVLIALLIGFLFFIYGLPLLQVTSDANPIVPAQTIKLQTPALGTD